MNEYVLDSTFYNFVGIGPCDENKNDDF